ncbi:MAG: hypothetical protein K6A36_07345 [Paludibacteraceae bacterium]|nr:hypothetical protein [Paludibacteraceae bacterium]
MKRNILLVGLIFCLCAAGRAETPVVHPDLHQPTGIAPAYFGPNAFPVPDMTDGTTYSQLRMELAAEGYLGYNDNRTIDIFARVHVPLFTRWANLSIWMPVFGWYSQYDGKGKGAGDAYISTDIQILHNDWFAAEKARWIPQMTLRLGMKTASGEQFERRRHYDCPGYFFDASIGENLCLSPVTVRLSASAGFLCWQTDNGRQNDAVMYGVQLAVKHEYVSLQATWGGYIGWEEHGDAPMTIKARVAGHVKGFEPYVQYQYGIKDYPYHQVRVGMAYSLDILNKRSQE